MSWRKKGERNGTNNHYGRFCAYNSIFCKVYIAWDIIINKLAANYNIISLIKENNAKLNDFFE